MLAFRSDHFARHEVQKCSLVLTGYTTESMVRTSELCKDGEERKATSNSLK
jgi:hypothetical protein